MIQVEIAKSKNMASDYSMFVSFPYEAAVVDAVKSLPARKYIAETKVWEVPAESFSDLIQRFGDRSIHIYGSFDRLFEKPVDSSNISFKYKTKPYKHQIAGVEFGLAHEKWLLGDEQGLGKTKQVIDIAVARKEPNHLKHCLIVCCVNCLKWNWANEVHTHSDEGAYILGQKQGRNGLVIGSVQDRLADIKRLDKIPEYFIITNIETLRNSEVTDALKELCEKGDIDMIAVDEFHKVKDPTTQGSKGLLKLKPTIRIAMTGTPVMNNPIDIYTPLRWLGVENHSYYQFKNHFCVMGGYGNYQVVGYRHLEEIKETLDKIMLRRLKEDVLDLPEKVYVDEYVDMTAKQGIVYKEVHADIKAHIDQIKIVNNPLAELIRLRQATGYTGILSSDIAESAKIDRLEEIVDDIVSNGKKAVIFSNWVQVLEPVIERLSKNHKGLVIDGATKDEDRARYVEQFQTDKTINFIVGTVGAMGTGITLTAASDVIFLDEPWTMANKQQAIDRCHRIGTKSTVTVYTIMCKNTIDERIHELVQKKGVMSDALIDGKIVGDKYELLNYLLS